MLDSSCSISIVPGSVHCEKASATPATVAVTLPLPPGKPAGRLVLRNEVDANDEEEGEEEKASNDVEVKDEDGQGEAAVENAGLADDAQRHRSEKPGAHADGGQESPRSGRRSKPVNFLKKMVTNEGFGTKRTSVNSTVAMLLDGVKTLTKTSSQDAENAAAAVQEDQACNFSIFQEEGQPPKRFPIITFLSPLAVSLDRLRIFFGFWSLVRTPMLLAFGDALEGFARQAVAVAMDYVADAIFLFGVSLAFITTAGNSSHGQEFLSLRDIAWCRLTSVSFWSDLLSIGPLLVELWTGQLPSSSFGPVHQIQVLKLFRIHWIVVMPASHFETRFWSGLQIVRMLAWIAMSMHLMACLWYGIVVSSGTLHYHLEQVQQVTARTHYLLAFQYGCYMVTGKPVVALSEDELILIALSFPFGGLFFAFIYGNTTMLLNRMNIRINKHHKHIAMITRTLSTLAVPAELKQRIKKYHHFLAVHHNTSAYTSLMQGLSVNLFIELRANLFSSLFSQGPFFEGAPATFLRRLLQIMVEVTFGPGDVVIRCGDIGDEMYFVVKGRLEVLDPSNNVLGQIHENRYFGEIALLICSPRMVSIRTATYCLLAMISRESFVPLLDSYPELKAKMLSSISAYKPVQKDDSDMEVQHQSSQDSKTSKTSSSSESSSEAESDRTSSKERSGGMMSRFQAGTQDALTYARRRISEIQVISTSSKDSGIPRRPSIVQDRKKVSFADHRKSVGSLPNLLEVPKSQRRESSASNLSGVASLSSLRRPSRRMSVQMVPACSASRRGSRVPVSFSPMGLPAQGTLVHGALTSRGRRGSSGAPLAAEEQERSAQQKGESEETVLKRFDMLEEKVARRLDNVEGSLRLLLTMLHSNDKASSDENT